MQELRINLAVAIPNDGGTIHLPSSGLLEAKGHTVPEGQYGPVMKAEVSADGGASLTYGLSDKFLEVPKAGLDSLDCVFYQQVILSRASDAGGNCSTWDFSVESARHRVQWVWFIEESGGSLRSKRNILITCHNQQTGLFHHF